MYGDLGQSQQETELMQYEFHLSMRDVSKWCLRITFTTIPCTHRVSEEPLWSERIRFNKIMGEKHKKDEVLNNTSSLTRYFFKRPSQNDAPSSIHRKLTQHLGGLLATIDRQNYVILAHSKRRVSTVPC